MSTRLVRTIGDFMRHGLDVDLECSCGHKAALDARRVFAHFKARGWYMGLHDGYGLGNPYSRFYCSVCRDAGRGKCRPKHIGPHYR
jgi:hypothetical protein